MLQLHFIYNQHSYQEAPMALWRKLHDLQKKRIKPLFVATEYAHATPDEIQKLEQDQALLREQYRHANQELIQHLQENPNIQTLQQAIDRAMANMPPEVLENLTLENQHAHMHMIGIQTIPPLYDVPLHLIETPNPTRQKRILTLIQSTQKPEKFQNLQDALKKYRKKIQRELTLHKARHTDVAKQLTQLSAQYPTNGHAIISFGGVHQGFEQPLLEYLKQKGITAQITSIEKEPWIDTLEEELYQKQFKNPNQKPPTDEEIAHSYLHNLARDQHIDQTIQQTFGTDYPMEEDGRWHWINNLMTDEKFRKKEEHIKNQIKQMTLDEAKNAIQQLTTKKTTINEIFKK